MQPTLSRLSVGYEQNCVRIVTQRHARATEDGKAESEWISPRRRRLCSRLPPLLFTTIICENYPL